MPGTLPLVSIIITSCNRSNLLKLTLDNILKQTYVNFEILIFLDNCSENYNSLRQSYKKENIKFFDTNSKHSNPAYPRNLGVQYSSGDLIAFCDDDDLWHPQKLELQVTKILNMNSDKKLVCSNFKAFYDDGELDKFEKINTISVDKNIHTFHLLFKNVIPLSSSLITRNCFQLNNKFEPANNIIEDWYLWLLLLDSVEIKKITDELLYYRIHKNSFFTGNKWSLRAKFFSTHLAALQKSKKYFFRRAFFLLFHLNVSIFSKALIRFRFR